MVLNIRVLTILWLVVSVYSICLRVPAKPKCTWSVCTITCSSGCGENLKNSLDQSLQNKPSDCQHTAFKLVTKDVHFQADIKNSLFSKNADFVELDLHINTITRINMTKNAFLSNQFRLLTSLSLKVQTILAGANTIHFNRDSLNGLTSLVKLSISGEKIQISSGILLGVASTLSDFTLSFPDDDVDLKLLTEEAHMPQLIALTIRAILKNSRIDSNLFIGVPNLIKLDLSDCKIDIIYANAFEPIANSLELLNLEKNNLKYLPAGIFDGFKVLVVLKVNNNPWICNTELCEFQRYLIKNQDFAIGVECQIPISGIPIILAKDLCPPEDSVLSLQCMNTKDELTILMNAQNMSITNGDNQDVTLKFDEIPHTNQSLMWFSQNFVNTTSIIDLKVNVENLNFSISYIFCLIDLTITRVSPLNCLSHYLDSSKNNCPLTWLTNDDKRDIYSYFFGGIILCLVLGLIAGYLLIAQNPMLLKGSSKIIVIRNCDRMSGASTTPFESISDWNHLGLHYRRSTIENDSSNYQYYMTANFPSRFDIVKSELDKSKRISTIENDYGIGICPNSDPPPLPDAMTYYRNKEEPIYATIKPFH